MKILVTGAKGMVGTALVNNLKNIRDNKNRTRPNISVEEIYEYDIDSTKEQLNEYCKEADFVFNLAGVNRPENTEDFMKGNFGFASQLLDTLKKDENPGTCYPLYMASYGAFRFVIEFFRTSSSGMLFHLSHIWAALAFAAGLSVYIEVNNRNHRVKKGKKVGRK